MKKWRSFFTIHLLPEFEKVDAILDETVHLYWDISEVSALQENKDELHARVRADFQAGGTTLDEFRARSGLIPYPRPELGGLNYHEMQVVIQADRFNALVQRDGNAAGTAAEDDAAENEDAEEKGFPLARKARQMLLDRKQAAERELEQARLIEYERELNELAQEALDGRIDRDEFERRLIDRAETNLLAFFLLGMLFGDDGELTDGEWQAINEKIIEAREAVTGGTLSDDIYSGRYGGVHRPDDAEGEPADIAARMALWAAAGGAAITLGRVYRRDDPLYQWRRGPTLRPCSDCVAADGLTMRAGGWRTNWPANKLPRSQGLECSGYHCLCDLYEVT
jgi:hypothetical protein